MELHARDLDGVHSTVEAYFDPSLNITWMADVLGWNDYGVSGWRLPSLDPTDLTADSNELAHLYYGLGNTGQLCLITEPCALRTGPFLFPEKTFPIETDHQNYDYTFNTGLLVDPNDSEGYKWIFSFEDGQTLAVSPYQYSLDWLVHDGDIGMHMPIPSSFFLLCSGLMALGAIRMKTRRR